MAIWEYQFIPKWHEIWCFVQHLNLRILTYRIDWYIFTIIVVDFRLWLFFSFICVANYAINDDKVRTICTRNDQVVEQKNEYNNR